MLNSNRSTPQPSTGVKLEPIGLTTTETTKATTTAALIANVHFSHRSDRLSPRTDRSKSTGRRLPEANESGARVPVDGSAGRGNSGMKVICAYIDRC